MNQLRTRLSHRRVQAAAVVASLVLGAGGAAAWAQVHNAVTTPAPVQSGSDLSTGLAPAKAAPPIASANANGVTVTLDADTSQNGSRVFEYNVNYQANALSPRMIGIPRIVNPDGSIVLPQQYGPVQAAKGASSLVPDAAFFDPQSIQSGATLRFGPFFRALDEGVSFTRAASELRSGFDLTIHGQPFLVSMTDLDGAQHQITFKALSGAVPASVVASHPWSTVTVTADGEALAEVHGSTNFAKTEDLDVNANTSAVVVTGAIADDAQVAVSVDSIGIVVKGDWDFHLAN